VAPLFCLAHQRGTISLRPGQSRVARRPEIELAWVAKETVRFLRSLALLAALGALAPAARRAPATSPAASAPAPPVAAPASPPSAEPPTAAVAADDARFDNDGALPAHAEDVVDYTFRASLDPVSHTVHGDGTITWRNTSQVPVKELWIHLYLNAFKNQHSAWLRAPAEGGRGTGFVDDWGTIDVRRFALREEGAIATDLWPNAELHRIGDEDETDARVPLPHEVQPGEKIQIDVTWDDKLPSIVERTGYWKSFHLVAQWFPKIARLEPSGRWAHFPFHHFGEFYADFGTYDVTLDVPQRFVLGATGPAIDTKVTGGRRVERHVQKDVHDFAWTAWDEWQTDKENIDGVQVTLLYPPSYKAVAERELRSMRFALPDFAARYGRYPYEVLTLVHPPFSAGEAGGMEYPTFITTGGPWYGPPGLYEVEITTIHEFGHQYFYGLIATNEDEWPFLDEGLNSYAEQLAMGTLRGPASLADVLGLTVSDAAVAAVYGNRVAHDAPVAAPSDTFPRGADIGGLVYERTAAIFETLRRIYGDDLVRKALGRYARKYRFAHPGPDELLAIFREVMGEEVERTLRTALFDKGWVDYAVTEISGGEAREAAGLFDRNGTRETVTPKLSQGFDGTVLVQRYGTLSFPFDVDLVRADGRTERVHCAESDAIRIPYHGDVPLRAAIVDPDGRVLLDEHPTNNFEVAPGQRRDWAPRTFERVLYWVDLAIQTVLP
jgi:Peptidase family M1 domain